MKTKALVCLLTIVWLAGAAPPQENTVNEPRQQQEAKATRPADGYAAYPNKYDDNCYNADNHDTADLCAQWRAATATEKAADLTRSSNIIDGLGAFFSFASLVLIVFTLILTKRQVGIVETDRDEARNEAAKLARDTASALAQSTISANAASEAAIAMQKQTSLLVAQQRAWVDIEAEIVGGRSDSEGLVIQWKVYFKNFGSTMAHDVVYSAIAVPIGVPEATLKIEKHFSDLSKGERNSAGTMLPDGRVWLGAKAKERFDTLPWDKKRRCLIMVIARADYRIEGDEDIHTTARAYAVAFRDKSMFRQRYIEETVDIAAGFKESRLEFIGFGPTIST